MASAARELLAGREQVWAFLAEPRHLADWWPGVVAVEPDRRGFAVGARWALLRRAQQAWTLGLPLSGRQGRPRAETLVVSELVPSERFAFAITWQAGGRARFGELRAAIELADGEPGRTRAALAVETGSLRPSRDRRLAAAALQALYDLVQTAAER